MKLPNDGCVRCPLCGGVMIYKLTVNGFGCIECHHGITESQGKKQLREREEALRKPFRLGGD
jgi:tRNA(Ile2) C34 agmatinyltransferase TiaS